MDYNISNIGKEYVTRSIATRMRALGYDEPCLAFFNLEGVLTAKGDEYELHLFSNSDLIPPACTAPTWQSAFKWFRDEYNLFGSVDYDKRLSWYYVIRQLISPSDSLINAETLAFFQSNEEAQQACLDKLCEMVENK